MRWWSIPVAVALGWFAFTLTPLWSLYDLAQAVQRSDADYVARHVNFRTLRVSLTRQLSAAIRSGSSQADSRERQQLGDQAMALALPLAEALITPQTVIDLLDDGWPESLDLPAAPPGQGAGLRIGSLRRLGAFYAATEMRGFRTVVISVPPHRTASEQFKIRLRLRDWSWRLVEIDLTETLRERIAEKVARGWKRGGQGAADEGSTADGLDLKR